MPDDSAWNETLEKKLTYHIEFDGRLFLIENVPARVNVETGERLQKMMWERCRPIRNIETQVYEYAALT